MKAIDTVYKGYRFRSRLEARWAVFFDNIKVRYEYEPEGFVLDDGTFYLPDFYLPEIDAYIEIKPVGAFDVSFEESNFILSDGREKIEKYTQAIETISKEHTFILLQGDPISAFIISEEGCAYAFYLGVCVPGLLSMDDPSITCTDGTKCVECPRRDEEHLVSSRIISFTSKSIIISYDDLLSFLPTHFEKFDIYGVDKGGKPIIPMNMSKDEFAAFLEANLSAMREARQARFEHGETPA